MREDPEAHEAAKAGTLKKKWRPSSWAEDRATNPVGFSPRVIDGGRTEKPRAPNMTWLQDTKAEDIFEYIRKRWTRPSCT